MVYVIKKSADGTRTVSANSPVSDLIKSLRGLTFKIEVKITDVVQNPVQTAEARSSEDQVPVTRHVVSKPAEIIAPTTQQLKNKGQDNTASNANPPTVTVGTTQSLNKHVRNSIDTGNNLTPVVSQQRTHKPDPTPSNQNVSDNVATSSEKESLTIKKTVTSDKPVEIAKVEIEKPTLRQPTTFEERIKQTRPYEEPSISERKRLGKSSRTLNRGELKIGSTVDSCCIAVDEEEDPPVAYAAYDSVRLIEIGNKIDEKLGDIEKLPPVTTPEVGDIVFGRSQEDNKWYRSVVEEVSKNSVKIFFFDWGLREDLPKSHIKHLMYSDLGLSENPACALKLHFLNRDPQIIQEVLMCDSGFRMKVESYDNTKESYNVFIEQINRP